MCRWTWSVWPTFHSHSNYVALLTDFQWELAKIGITPTSVRPSVHKSFFDFDEIWFTCSTRWEMHNGMTLTQIQGQVKVTGTWKLQNHPNSKSISFAKIRSVQWLMVDCYTTVQYLKFNQSHFKNSSAFFVTWRLNFVPNHLWQVIFYKFMQTLSNLVYR